MTLFVGLHAQAGASRVVRGKRAPLHRGCLRNTPTALRYSQRIRGKAFGPTTGLPKPGDTPARAGRNSDSAASYQRTAARRDLLEHFVYLADNASLDTAERFLAEAEASFNDLSHQPLMGAPLTLRHPDLAGMRKRRVLHRSRDGWGLLGLDL